VLVWLRAVIKIIEKRITEDNTTLDYQPALTSDGSVKEIQETLLLRNPFYEGAMDFFVDTDVMDIEAVCDTIWQKIKRYEYKTT